VKPDFGLLQIKERVGNGPDLADVSTNAAWYRQTIRELVARVESAEAAVQAMYQLAGDALNDAHPLETPSVACADILTALDVALRGAE
jgi:hypothetical protein